MLENIFQDLKYAWRSLARRPLVTSVAVLSLALGIGVNTAIFSVFDRLLLRRLPVSAPEDIVLVISPGPRPGGRSVSAAGGVDHVFSYPLFRDIERLPNTGLSHVAAHRGFSANVAYDRQQSAADGLLVSGGYFPALGIKPALGRLLTQDDDRTEGGHPVVVLAHQYWTTAFGADPGVIGRSMVVNGEPMTIVGVAPAGFSGTVAQDFPQFFASLSMVDHLRTWGIARRDHYLYVFGRLAPGVSRDRAQAALDVPFRAILRDVEFPAFAASLTDAAREQFLRRGIVLRDGARMRIGNPGEAKTILGLLLAVTGLVLLIACANVANLLLTKAADRAGEMGVRLSMGASRGRLVRLLSTEALLMGAAGAGGALLIARATTVALTGLLPAEDAGLLGFELNASILMFTLGLGLATALLFGLVPALYSIRSTLAGMTSSRTGRVSASRGATRFRTSLATAQVALATALLAQAGLLVTSLVNLGRVDIGIEREGLVAFRLRPYLNGYTAERAQAFFDRIEDELRAIPGVRAAGASTVALLSDDSQGQFVKVEGFTPAAEGDTRTSAARIGSGYFETVGIPMIAGRDFTRADAERTPKVAIVNEAFVRKFGLGSQPLGRRVGLGTGPDTTLDIEIVGLVRDAKYNRVREAAPPQLFLPYRQAGVAGLTFYARFASDPEPLRAIIPSLVARADPNLPVERLRTMDEQIWENIAGQRIFATLSSWFAGLALLLAGIGLYAVLGFMVSQRSHEIGIRMALGATAADVGRLLGTHVGRIAIVGGGIGMAVAVALGRLGSALLFEVSGTDITILAAAVGAIALVIIVAAAVPTRRAIRVNPVVALRAD